MASKSYSMKNINKVPQGIALRLRRICDTTEKYESRADEQKHYLLARDYKTSFVDEQFKKIGQISREDARSKPKTNQVSKIKFVTKYNPMLPKVDGIITKDISIQHSHNTLKTLFPKDCFSNIYKRNKSLKELIVPSIYSNKINTKTSCITSCNNCDICKNYMVFDKTFNCTVTGKSYFRRGQLNCKSINVAYIITCSKCLEQYVSSAVKFKPRFPFN